MLLGKTFCFSRCYFNHPPIAIPQPLATSRDHEKRSCPYLCWLAKSAFGVGVRMDSATPNTEMNKSVSSKFLNSKSRMRQDAQETPCLFKLLSASWNDIAKQLSLSNDCHKVVISEGESYWEDISEYLVNICLSDCGVAYKPRAADIGKSLGGRVIYE